MLYGKYLQNIDQLNDQYLVINVTIISNSYLYGLIFISFFQGLDLAATLIHPLKRKSFLFVSLFVSVI